MKFAAIICLAVLVAVASVARADSEEDVPAGSPYRRQLHRLFANERITNGFAAEKNAYPYQVSLHWGLVASLASHSCGGSIISEGWVVTAGHCFTELPSFGTHIVYAGKHNIKNTESTQQSSKISKYFVHPSYVGGVAPHDIALIKLATPFTFNSVVSAISLPAQDTVHNGDVVLTGWGSTSLTLSPSMPSVLQTVTIPIVDTTTCYNIMSIYEPDPPLDPKALWNVCTGPLDSSRISACSGDSGGPLVQKVNGKLELVGIVSWGLNPCGTVGVPSVFTRASAYANWVSETVAANK